MNQPKDGEWYEASDDRWYCWPDPTPYDAPPPGVLDPPAPAVVPNAASESAATPEAGSGLLPPAPPAMPTYSGAQPATALASPPPARLSVSAALLLVVGAGASVFGCFRPWVRSVFDDILGHQTDDGQVFVVVALLSALLAVVALVQPNRRPLLVGVILLSAMLLAGGVFEIADITRILREGKYATARVGYGLYFILGGALTSLIGAVKGLADVRGDSVG